MENSLDWVKAILALTTVMAGMIGKLMKVAADSRAIQRDVELCLKDLGKLELKHGVLEKDHLGLESKLFAVLTNMEKKLVRIEERLKIENEKKL